MQKAVFKQQFEAFTISSSEGLEKGYDRFQQLLSQLEAHGAEVSTEDANHKFLRSLPPTWSNLAMTMRTKPDVDTLSIDDMYNNLRVFEQEILGCPQKHFQVLKMLLLFHKAKAALIRDGHKLADSNDCYSNEDGLQEIRKRELFVDGKALVGFDKKKLECFNWTPEPEPSDIDDRSSECSTCQSNDSAGSIGTSSEHSVDLEYEISRVPQEVYVSKPITTNEKGVSASKSKENAMMERELGEGYSFTKMDVLVCGSLSHLIKDCDYYEQKMAREVAPKKQRVFNTGNGVTKPIWNNADMIIHANHFVLRSVILNSCRLNVNSVRPNVNYIWSNVNTEDLATKYSTKCLILSCKGKLGSAVKNFSSAMEIQYLTVPRHHNMYSFDMKTPTPVKGFACLIAKATSDESKM
ncbi:hypothetical protein Tco_1343446 [Tanacetum coccineum]